MLWSPPGYSGAVERAKSCKGFNNVTDEEQEPSAHWRRVCLGTPLFCFDMLASIGESLSWVISECEIILIIIGPGALITGCLAKSSFVVETHRA